MGIIFTLKLVETGTTGGGDKVCVGSGMEADRSIVASTLVANGLLISGEAYVAVTSIPDINFEISQRAIIELINVVTSESKSSTANHVRSVIGERSGGGGLATRPTISSWQKLSRAFQNSIA